MHVVLPSLTLGLALGFRHVLEADHIAAITTILTEQKNPRKAALTGALWGIGHAGTIVAVGIPVLLLRVTIPGSLNRFVEFLVGLLIIGMGLRLLLTLRHPAGHDDHHSHTHHSRSRPLLIGALQGLAGSGLLTVVVLSSFHSVLEGLAYLSLFSIGLMSGMTLLSLGIGIPIAYTHSGHGTAVHRWLHLAAGILSVLIGLQLAVTTLTS